jgi:hypothetical protein
MLAPLGRQLSPLSRLIILWVFLDMLSESGEWMAEIHGSKLLPLSSLAAMGVYAFLPMSPGCIMPGLRLSPHLSSLLPLGPGYTGSWRTDVSASVATIVGAASQKGCTLQGSFLDNEGVVDRVRNG